MQELTPKQTESILNKARYKVLNWGRRSGKTTVFGYEALGTSLSVPDAKTTYYAQTFGDARDIAWDIFLDIFGDAVLKKNETLLEITLANTFGGTSKVSLKGWESVVTGGKGRGTENDLLLFDEVAFCRSFLTHWEKTLEPTLLTTKGRAVFGSTPNGFNDFHKLAQQAQRDPLWFYSHATSYDNPFNDPADLDRIKASRSEDAFAQEYLADFRKVEGLVYKDFDENRHVVATIPEEILITKRGVIDFGFQNPAAIYTIARDKDNNYYVYDEYYETGKLQDELNQQMTVRKLESWYPDHAEADRLESMRRAGLRVNEISKDVAAGIDTVQNLLRQNRLFIHKNCTNLIFEFNFYRWREKTGSQIMRNEPEEPIKEHDHGLDAIRYGLHMWEATHRAPKGDYFIPEPPLFSDIGI